MSGRLGFLTACLLFVGVALVLASAPAVAKTPHVEFHGIAVTERRVLTEDGATLSLVELAGNDDGAVVVIQPGLVETAQTFDDMASYFHGRGFKVILMQSRYVGRGAYRSQLSPTADNGLEDILLKDTAAAWRYVLRRLPAGRKFHVIGHSKGGMQILAALNQPALAAEFASHIATATLLAAPDRIEDVPVYVREICKRLIPWLERMHRGGVRAIDVHHGIFGQLKGLKDAGALGGFIARLIERPVALIAHEVMIGVLLSRFTSSRETRRLVRQEISAFPVKLLLDFARAVVTGRLPVPMSGAALTVPTQVFSAEYDLLVRTWHQRDLFISLNNVPREGLDGERQRRWVIMEDTHHVDPVVSKRLGAVMLPLMLEFMADPAAAATRARMIDITRVEVEAVSRTQCRLMLMPAV